MKYILIIISIFITASCSSDDDSQVLTSDSIVGVWSVMRITTILDGNHHVQIIHENCSNNVPSREFKNNFTGINYRNNDNCTSTRANEFRWEKTNGHYIINPDADIDRNVIDVNGDIMAMSFTGSDYHEVAIYKRIR